MKKETDKKLGELEDSLRHYRLLTKNANDHIFRLEEKEQDLKSELSAQNERYTKLLKIYVDYIETNNLSVSSQNFEPGTVCVGHKTDMKSNDPVLRLTTDSPPTDNNSHQNPNESGDVLKNNTMNSPNIDVDLTQCEPNANISASLIDTLKANNRTSSFIDLYEDTVDYEIALESVSIAGPGDDAEDVETLEVNDPSLGMIKEVEKLIKENNDLHETKNALNVLKDDLIRKLDEVTGEKAMLIQEMHGVRMDRDSIKSEANRLSRLIYECRDQISSLTARLKVYEDVNEVDRHSSRLYRGPIQQSKSCWTLNVEDHSENENYASKSRNKSVDNLSDVLPSNDLIKNEDGNNPRASVKKVSKFGEACFTKREMARVIAERNNYKEKFLELQDAVRLAERLRGDRESRVHQVSTNTYYGRVVPRSPSISESFFSAVQSSLSELFSSFDQGVPLASALPSEAQCYGPYQFDNHNYSNSQSSNKYTNSPGARRRKSLGLRSMFSKLFGYAVAYGADASIGVGHDLVVGLGSQSLSDEIMSKSQLINKQSNYHPGDECSSSISDRNSISQMSNSSSSTQFTGSSTCVNHIDHNRITCNTKANVTHEEQSSHCTQLPKDASPTTPTSRVIQC
ncbi:unnamed protein product [Heterobilharzia americana]|nr:unnamed protein product [Heterobilharzia americana]